MCGPGAGLLHLAANEIHVWTADLDRPDPPREHLASVLTAPERCRAARFLRPIDRDRAVASRGLLRMLLARYTAMPPHEVPIAADHRGKPYVTGLPWAFNVSHSEGLCVYAVSLGRRVGIDVERVRPMPHMDDLVRRFFAPRERREFAGLPSCQRQEAFYNAWTRKEAYVKATGVGMHEPLERFAVSLRPGEPAELFECASDPAAADRWRLFGWQVAPGYVGALAVESDGRPIRCADPSLARHGLPVYASWPHGAW
jgi:4'-phosphopantetheinyl transferase